MKFLPQVFVLLLLLNCFPDLYGQNPPKESEAVAMEAPPPPSPGTEVQAPADVNPGRATRGKRGGRYGFYDHQYVYVPFIYDQLPRKYSNFMKAKKAGKYGIINKRGKEIIPIEYDWLFVRNVKGTNERYIEVQKGGLRGILDITGKEVVPIQYSKLQWQEGILYIVETPDQKYGLLQIDGKALIPPIYERGLTKGLKNQYVTYQEGKAGLLDTQGEVLLPFEYNYIRKLTYSNYLRVSKDGKVGLMDSQLTYVLSPEYTSLDQKPHKFILAKKGGGQNLMDGKWGVLSPSFQSVVPIEYDQIELGAGPFFRVVRYQPSGEGVIDTLGKVILPCEFQRIYFPSIPKDHLIARKKGELLAVYNRQGKQVVPPTYSKVQFQRNFTVVTDPKSNKQTVLDSMGEPLTAFVYDRMYAKRDPKSRRELKYILYGDRDGTTYVITPEGKEISVKK